MRQHGGRRRQWGEPPAPGPAGEPLPVGAVRLLRRRRAVIEDSAEALDRIVADIPDPVGKARAALSGVDLIQG